MRLDGRMENNLNNSDSIEEDMPYAVKFGGRSSEVLVRGKMLKRLMTDKGTVIEYFRKVQGGEMYSFKHIIG